ncbi:MAG: D-alanyl-D-alanine carboxypeptidase/D-alanyl-D-alanine-endopeptidase [Bacteroidota bacterium]
MRRILTPLLLLFLALPAKASTERLNALLDAPPVANSHVGIEVRTLDGNILFEHDSRKLFTPASVQKLFTALAALHYLGSDSRFRTEWGSDAPPNATLEGDLVLKGYGDPSLKQEDLDEIVAALRSRGVRKIEGDLIAASSWEPQADPPGWMNDDLGLPYAARVSGLSLDGNATMLTIRPGKKPGDPVVVSPSYLRWMVEAKTETLGRLREESGRIVGSLGLGVPPWQGKRTVPNPPQYAGWALFERLKAGGIELAGTVRVAPTPKGFVPWGTHWSPPLAALVRSMNKESDNFLAETLLCQLGALEPNSSSLRGSGLKSLRTLLDQCSSSAYRIEDGSGLSRYDAISPALLNDWLQFATHHAEKETFLASLPIAGEDGTLAQRPLKGGRLRAKTGTMAGVSSLSGVLDGPDRTLLVTVLINGFVGSARPIQRWQDEFLEALLED